jgi:signal transduction histidine kinase/ActR/RegA family two-component response regulator
MAQSDWYVTAMQQLVAVVQQLSQARDLEKVASIVRQAARSLTSADGATFVLRDGADCYYLEENAIGPLWKGRRFPLETCISGWVMLNREPAIIEDIYQDKRIPHDAYRPTFVKSLVMVPICRENPIAAIGNYWADQRVPTQEEVEILQALADTTSVALENARLYGDLQSQLTELKTQEIRILAQREALEVFTRALAHDLKEPIRTIRSFIELLDEEEDPEQSTEYFDFIKAAAERMGILIDTVFRYTQLDDPELATKEKCSMDRSLSDALQNMESLVRDSQAVITSDKLPEVSANQVQMTQLWQNLIANAIRHSTDLCRVKVGVASEEGQWVFSVVDNGPGIAPEFHDSIFQPFKRLTRRNDCSGLGLAACRKIVESHGGKIWCDSKPGKGATFQFTLPRHQETVIVAALSTEVSQASVKSVPIGDKLANVLLVDDREDDVALTRMILFNKRGLSCNLSVAYDGLAGLKMLQEAHENQNPIDLVLLDINMPVMNGFELLEQVQQIDAIKNIPIIMCTGSTYEKDKSRAASLGAVGYLEKPPAMDKLKQIVTDLSTVRIHLDGSKERLLSAVHAN